MWPPTLPTYPQCPTQLDTGNVTVARMTLYDSEANYLAGGANYTTEETCFAGCNALNVNNTIIESIRGSSRHISPTSRSLRAAARRMLLTRMRTLL